METEETESGNGKLDRKTGKKSWNGNRELKWPSTLTYTVTVCDDSGSYRSRSFA